MPLEVKLEIERTDLLVQENPYALVTFTNTGKTPIQYLHPSMNENSPMMRVVDLRTGAETIQVGHVHHEGERYLPLLPGQTVSHRFKLRTRLHLTLPGEYQVSAIMVGDLGKERGESNKVNVTIRPASSRAMSIVSVSGGWAVVSYLFSINPMVEPVQITRHTIGFTNESGVDDARLVTKAPMLSEPVASAPRNRSVATNHWLAWIEEDSMRFAYYDGDKGETLVTGRWALPGKESRIVTPLNIEPRTDRTRPPAGAAVVWTGDPITRSSFIQVVDLLPTGKATAGARATLTSYRPLDIASFARSDGKRLVTYIDATATGIALHTLPWPDQALASNPPKKLCEWKGEFIASGAVLDAKDGVLGATMMLLEAQTNPRLVIVKWSLDEKNQFTQEAPDVVQWPYANAIRSAIVRVGPDGNPAALIVSGEGRWYFYDGYEKVTPAPPVLAVSRMPMDMVFVDRGRPILISSVPSQGLKLLFPDGSHVPHSCG
jgi:hypothetical protein